MPSNQVTSYQCLSGQIVCGLGGTLLAVSIWWRASATVR